MSCYLSVETVGDKIIERYLDDEGVEHTREVVYAPTMFIHTNRESEYKDIYGKYCLPKKFETISECRDWIRQTEDIVDVLGMNDFKLAYLSDTYKEDITYDIRKIRIANCDIEVTGDTFPNPAEARFEIDAITHYDSVDDKFYVFDLLNSQYASVDKWDRIKAALPASEGGDEVPQEILDKVVYMDFDNERDMLLEYINLWEQNRPAIFTGWNVEGFDIPYIINRIKNVLGEQHVKRLSSIGKITSRTITDDYQNEKTIYSIRGVTILDYINLYKKFRLKPRASYKLDYIAKVEVNAGKLEYTGKISKLRETNHQRYISYNIVDVDTVQALDKKLGYINLAISLSYYARIPFDGVMGTIKIWDGIIFNSLKANKGVVPPIKQHIRQTFGGAFVKEPQIKAQKYVMSFDLTSLYPSIIRQVGISPECIAGSFRTHPIMDYVNKVAPRPSDEFSCSPNGWMYRKDQEGVIPKEITKVFLQRKQWKGKMLACERNIEVLNKILAEKKAA